MRQILNTRWQQSKLTRMASSSEWSVRFPNKTITQAGPFKLSLSITKASMFAKSIILSRSDSCSLLYSIRSIFDGRNNRHKPENNDSRATGRSRARAEYLTHRELSNGMLLITGRPTPSTKVGPLAPSHRFENRRRDRAEPNTFAPGSIGQVH